MCLRSINLQKGYVYWQVYLILRRRSLVIKNSYRFYELQITIFDACAKKEGRLRDAHRRFFHNYRQFHFTLWPSVVYVGSQTINTHLRTRTFHLLLIDKVHMCSFCVSFMQIKYIKRGLENHAVTWRCQEVIAR